VDSREQTEEVAETLSYPVCYGVTRDVGDKIGAWWEERRDHIQPSEFLMTSKGRVLSSTYSASPVGRMDPKEALSLVRVLSESKPKT
jgi:hypothetical protein